MNEHDPWKFRACTRVTERGGRGIEGENLRCVALELLACVEQRVNRLSLVYPMHRGNLLECLNVPRTDFGGFSGLESERGEYREGECEDGFYEVTKAHFLGMRFKV